MLRKYFSVDKERSGEKRRGVVRRREERSGVKGGGEVRGVVRGQG